MNFLLVMLFDQSSIGWKCSFLVAVANVYPRRLSQARWKVGICTVRFPVQVASYAVTFFASVQALICSVDSTQPRWKSQAQQTKSDDTIWCCLPTKVTSWSTIFFHPCNRYLTDFVRTACMWGCLWKLSIYLQINHFHWESVVHLLGKRMPYKFLEL